MTLARPLRANRVNNTYHQLPKKKTRVLKPVKLRKKPKKTNPIKSFLLFTFGLLLVLCVFPYAYNKVIRPVMFGPAHSEIKTNYHTLYSPTSNYLNNYYFNGVRLLESTNTKNPKMQSLYVASPMTKLTSRLANLINQYPSIKPSIYVWDFETGNYVDIRGDEQFSAASIIKLPILMQLFKSIEAGQLKLTDRIPLTEYYRTGGSGGLQFQQAGRDYSVDYLAKIMIQNSDNSATNMIMSAIGGKVDVNSALRDWGIKKTYVSSWLPDLPGTNVTTAKDMATILYNIDNSSFLNLYSREKIVEYMSHVHNNRLLQAGLPNDAILIHKTGDIGKMLGDAGIVWTSNGKKYIVVMLVNRPYNSPSGKEFIVKSSRLIYNSILRGSI